ncbi:MAG: DUF4097 family beta strand repeat-containing protein [Chloroflexota bacterium]
MAYETFDTIKAPHIILKECDGAVVIRSSSGNSLRLKGDDYTIDPQDDQFTIKSTGDLKLYVPTNSTITAGAITGELVIKNISGAIQLDEVNGEAVLRGISSVQATAVHGSLTIKNCDGPLHIAQIYGDAYLRNVGDVTIEQVNGDLSGRNINGDVSINSAQGDVALRTVNGRVAVNTCYRDVNLRNLGGQLNLAKVQGDVRLFDSLPNGDHTIVAQGDIVLRWPPDAPLTLIVQADEITNDLPLENMVEKEGMLTGQLGDNGKTTLSLTARRAILRPMRSSHSHWHMDGEEFDFNFDFNMDLEKLGEQISAQVTEQVTKATAHFEDKFGGDFAQKTAEKWARKVEQAAERAERAAEKARRRAEQQMSADYMDRRRRTSVAPAPPKAKEVNPEEQLKILQMVEKGLISPEEATMLLDALEE